MSFTTADLQRLASEGSPTMKANIEAALAPAGVTLTKPHENHTSTPRIQDAKPLERPAALAVHNEAQAQGAGRTALCFTLRRVRLLDPCAKFGSCKALIDGLRFANIIRDDREEDITLEVRQEKVAHFKDEETIIEITIPDSAQDSGLTEVISTDHARKLKNALRILWGDVTHLKHWVPDPCRRLVEAALANN